MNMESTLSVATTATQMFSSRESMFITTRPRVRYIKNNQFSFNLFENFGGDCRRVMKCFSICRKKVCAPRRPRRFGARNHGFGQSRSIWPAV